MKLVMTIMVRDEIDVLPAMLEHHIAQGIDQFVVTDNGSVDGTLQLLEDYRDRGLVQLHEDPVHQKQQTGTVTKMAREAYVEHGADWVINADADEFWVAVNPSVTLREALEHTPTSVQSFQVPVIDMTGTPAVSGSGFDRLIYRDNRSTEALNAIGLIAHSTPDAVHIGHAEIDVAQGNHTVSLESFGRPATQWSIEVLHLPWRSWNQFHDKVSKSGKAYEANPTLKPSPNHHGMREYQRFLSSTLLPFYLVRHPSEQEIVAGLPDGTFVLDDRLRGLESGSIPSVRFLPAEEDLHRFYGKTLLECERAARESAQSLRDAEARIREAAEDHDKVLSEALAARRENVLHVESLETQILILEDQIAEYRARLIIRLADRTANLRRIVGR